VTTIAAIVSSLPAPKRQPLLLQALQSVWDQTRQPDDMVVGADYSMMGEVPNMNRLLRATECDWLAFLHDDDVWHPDHLAVCEKHTDNADVVVSRFDLVGRPPETIEPWHDDFEDLRRTNWIGSPSMVVVRRAMFGEWVGHRGKYRWNDWSQWNWLLDRGARFVDTKTITVKYRFGDWGNGSWS
jgi:glycosyltransferase involved in cell wall biosynthesis